MPKFSTKLITKPKYKAIEMLVNATNNLTKSHLEEISDKGHCSS